MSTEDEHVAPFAKTLAELDHGTVHARLSNQLHDLIAAVTTTGKKGTLTLQLSLEVVTKGRGETLKMTAATALKAPEADNAKPVTVFFVDPAGNLTRDNPTQPQLPLIGLPTRKDITA
jgi:hypothetical protein